MSPLLLVAATLCLSAPPSPETARAEYQSKKSQLARTADAQVELALWCESKGLLAERDTHLALALLRDPEHATARGLLGQVHHDGRWQRPEAVAETLRKDADWNAKRVAYEAKRLKTPVEAEPQWKLANWCLDQGLSLEARAHFVAVIKLDPSRELAWKKLGYKRIDGRWIMPVDQERLRAEERAQAEADRKWRPILDRLSKQLNDPRTRARAEAELSDITDPGAILSITRVFLNGPRRDETIAANQLGHIQSPLSTKVLAWMAVAASNKDARQAAVEILRRRDPREFVESWIKRIRKPIRYEVRLPRQPGESGVLLIQDDATNLRREFQTLAVNFQATPQDRVVFDQNGLPVVVRSFALGTRPVPAMNPLGIDPNPQDLATLQGLTSRGGQPLAYQPVNPSGNTSGTRPAIGAGGWRPAPTVVGTLTANVVQDTFIPLGEMQRDAERSRLSAEAKMRAQVVEIDRWNDGIRQSNQTTLIALEEITNQKLGEDPSSWLKWWGTNQGYHFAMTEPDRETVYETVPVTVIPQAVMQVGPARDAGYFVRHACFAAGTPVHTREGLKPIETLREGDAVLTQKAADGSLSFQPILEVFHNPPSDTLRVKAGEETYVATGIHRFWKAGKGWTMARDLVAGDEIRTLSGKAKVDSIRSDLKQPVFNLKVAEGNSYLIGKAGALVHDNSIVEPEERSFDQIRK